MFILLSNMFRLSRLRSIPTPITPITPIIKRTFINPAYWRGTAAFDYEHGTNFSAARNYDEKEQIREKAQTIFKIKSQETKIKELIAENEKLKEQNQQLLKKKKPDDHNEKY